MSTAASTLDLDLKSVLPATDLSPAFKKPLRHASPLPGIAEQSYTSRMSFRRSLFDVWTGSPGTWLSGRFPGRTATSKYLFGTDFGEASLSVLPHAVSFASRMKARLILAHVE